MRPGLIVVGGLLCVLGAGVVSAFYLFPGPSYQQVERTGAPVGIAPSATANFSIVGLPGAVTRFDFQWGATPFASVAVYPAAACTGGGCGVAPLVSWNASSGAHWTHAGSLAFPLVVLVHAPSNGSALFSYSAVTTVPAPPPMTGLTAILVDLAGGALLAIGGIAVFLGIFLRGNPYGPPPPLISRSAEDADAIARSGDPPRP
jgi:hypothetical protein